MEAGLIGKKFNQKWIVRVKKNEELVSALKSFCFEHEIRLGSVSGIGACNYAKIGLFDVGKKEYYSKEFSENMEITSLTGNITTKDNEIYIHLHINLSNQKFEVIGGHLDKANISATCEIIIDTIDGSLDRCFDQEIGINLLSL